MVKKRGLDARFKQKPGLSTDITKCPAVRVHVHVRLCVYASRTCAYVGVCMCIFPNGRGAPRVSREKRERETCNMTKYVTKHDTMSITTWPNVQLHMQPTFVWVVSLLAKSNIWGGVHSAPASTCVDCTVIQAQSQLTLHTPNKPTRCVCHLGKLVGSLCRWLSR